MIPNFTTHISGKISGKQSYDSDCVTIFIRCVQTGKYLSWNNAVRAGWFAIKNPRFVEIKGEPDYYMSYLSPEGESEWRAENEKIIQQID